MLSIHWNERRLVALRQAQGDSVLYQSGFFPSKKVLMVLMVD